MSAVSVLLSAAVGYLLGSVNFGYLYGRLFRGVDIRRLGSGNAGATNALRVFGKGPAAAVLLLDVGKAAAAVAFGRLVGAGEIWAPVAGGLAAVVGHNWPVFFRFRGGKGIASTIGAMASLSFVPTLVAGAVAIAVIALTRYVSVGSLVFVSLLPPLFWAMRRPSELVWASVATAVLAFVRHRQNLVRLRRGTEHRLGGKRGDVA